MPIYEYSCRQCGHRFEKLLKHATDESVVCPSCGSSLVVRECSSFSSTGSISNASYKSGG
jgi:putative FmdB family regulatory protein